MSWRDQHQNPTTLRNITTAVSTQQRPIHHCDSNDLLVRLGASSAHSEGAPDISYPDVPLLLSDFAMLVGKAEGRMMHQRSFPVDLEDGPLLRQLRVCAALDYRLTKFFQAPPADIGHSSAPSSLNVRKLEKDHHQSHARLARLVEEFTAVRNTRTVTNGGWTEDSASVAPFSDYSKQMEPDSCSIPEPVFIRYWDESLDRELRQEKRDALQDVEREVRSLRELQAALHTHVNDADAPIEGTCKHTEATARDTGEATRELAVTSRGTARWWPLHGSGAGAVIGGVVGIALGPLGVVAGAAIGGAGGLMAANNLKSRHTKKMNRLIERLDEPPPEQ